MAVVVAGLVVVVEVAVGGAARLDAGVAGTQVPEDGMGLGRDRQRRHG